MSCLWAGGPAQSLSNPCPGPQILVILTTFPIEKSILSFCLSGSVKMPFWPYFDPILSPPEPNLWPLAKMCLFRPTARMDLGGTLRDPKFDHILTILDPFEGPGGRLRLAPCRAAFRLEDLLRASQTHARTSNFGHFDHFWTSCEPQKWPHFDHFGPKTSRSGNLLCPVGALLRHLARTLWKCQFWPILVILDPSGGSFS